jgi:Protein of unknown function (DUF3489)
MIKSFTITPDLNVTAYESHQDAAASGHAVFISAKEMDALLTSVGIKPVELWNALPGVTPVKKFMNRSAGIKRMWAQLQGLDATPASQEASIDRPKRSPLAKKAAAAAVKATRAPRVGKAVVASDEGRVSREGSKEEIVVGMLKRKGGATREEIEEATGWQSHSVRGFISGVVKTKLALPVESFKNEAGERAYRLA